MPPKPGKPTNEFGELKERHNVSLTPTSWKGLERLRLWLGYRDRTALIEAIGWEKVLTLPQIFKSLSESWLRSLRFDSLPAAVKAFSQGLVEIRFERVKQPRLSGLIIKKLYAKGLTVEEFAESINIPREQVDKLLMQAPIPGDDAVTVAIALREAFPSYSVEALKKMCQQPEEKPNGEKNPSRMPTGNGGG